MILERTVLADVAVVTPQRHKDERGFFSEVYSARSFAERVADVTFVQDNHSWSRDAGTIRGLHFQLPPHAQGKLVRVARGCILDVAVDLRRTSPTFGRHVAVELSAENWKQMWVPPGFAHGFCTLTPDCEVLYKVTALYAASHDRGLRFDDPALGIEWPVSPEAAVVSVKDRAHPRLADLAHVFD